MKKLGIIRETKNKWERRVPLNPAAVRELIEKGFEVAVQSSSNRIYKDEEYRAVGAVISEDLRSCDFIIGVKEIYEPDLVAGIPHLYFAHVIKGQSLNMPMLHHIIDNQITLFDYEKITDYQNRRLVFFGVYAGNAGMIDTLHGLGQRLMQEYGIETPFLKIRSSYQYQSVQDALSHIREIGQEIKKDGLPAKILPFNIFLLGYGHVSQGARTILEALPIQEISPADIKKQMPNPHRINLITFRENDMVKRYNGDRFELMDYYNNPGEYSSKMEEFLDHCSVYVNAIYWDEKYPQFLPKDTLKKLQSRKLIIIGDITCDIDGSVQATQKATWPDNPVYIYNAENDSLIDGYKGEGIAVMAVDNLPCEFPKEASDSFSKALMPFMESLLITDYSKPIAQSGLPAELIKACIVHRGKLQPDFLYLMDYLH